MALLVGVGWCLLLSRYLLLIVKSSKLSHKDTKQTEAAALKSIVVGFVRHHHHQHRHHRCDLATEETVKVEWISKNFNGAQMQIELVFGPKK